MSARSKISVCMPTYNGEKYIKEQLESILLQLRENDEVIISDDRSTDKTIDIINSLNDKRIKVFIHPEIKNPYRGPNTIIFCVYKNVENALKHATGDYIFFSDQDDVWLPNKVERVMEEFNKGAESVLHNVIIVDKNSNPIIGSKLKLCNPSRNIIMFFLRHYFLGAAMAFTKRIKDLSLPMPNNPIGHEHWIACNIWTHGKNISFIEEALMLYRRHGNNVSPTSEKSKNPLWFKISYRFRLLFSYLYSMRKK